jgi:hypothetical protein
MDKFRCQVFLKKLCEESIGFKIFKFVSSLKDFFLDVGF